MLNDFKPYSFLSSLTRWAGYFLRPWTLLARLVFRHRYALQHTQTPSHDYSSAHRRSRNGMSSLFAFLLPSTSARHAQYSPRRISAYEA